MICQGCNQELADNQTCQACSPVTPPPPDTEPGQQPNTPGAAAPSPSESPSEARSSSRHAKFDLWHSSIDAGGDVRMLNLAAEHISIFEQPNKVQEESSLQDSVKELTDRTARNYHPSKEELQSMVARLIEDQLILISSSFDEYALDTAWAVIEALRLSVSRSECRITFDDLVTRDVEFSLQSLCQQWADTDKETVLLVEALHSQANTFPDSVIGTSSRVDAARQDLKNSKLLLVVVINHEYAIEKKLSQRNLSYKAFSYWNIPFLQPFFNGLFGNHEQLVAEITKQRHKWEAAESKFTQQIINYYEEGRLLEVIQSGGPEDPHTAAESMLKKACPVQKTVLYTATFFDEITSPEFCCVVESLLGTRTMLMEAPDMRANGSTPTPANIEVPLRRLWDETKDDIFTDLLIETTTGTDSPRTVSLSEFNLGDPLRKFFEKRHRFYLLDQFKALQYSGIFFYPSLRLAQNTTKIAVEMAQLYPDEFDEGWIVALVMRISEYFAVDASGKKPIAEDAMFRFLANTQPGAFNLAFARVSEICKCFLKSPRQKRVVPNSLEYLMKTGYEQEVLWLIKQLKFNPEFDDWYWLKQLLHRGDFHTKYLTYNYILSYLKQMGTGVYDGLKKIETWLPPIERSHYSDFDTFMFRILIKYCLDTIGRFNEKHYGKWPSRYALFNLPDAETANANLPLLVRWLLHPGVDDTLAGLNIVGTRVALLAILFAEWSFILLGTPAVSQAASDSSEHEKQTPAQESPADWSGAQLLELLIKELVGQLDSVQRLELLKYWTHLESELFKASRSWSLGEEVRRQSQWKKELIQTLRTKLKTMPPAKPSVKSLRTSLPVSSPA